MFRPVKEFEEFVRTVPDGWFNVQDGRATLKGLPLSSEDLIGGYRVLCGRFAVGEDEPNRGYSVLTENGMMTPHPEIRTRLLAVMRALPFHEAAMASSVGARGYGTEAPEPPSLSPIAAETFNQLYHRAHQLMKGQLVLDGAPTLPTLGWSGRRRLKKAIHLLQEAIDLNPSSWESMFSLGKIHQRLADADVALDWFLRAHELSPTNRSAAKEAGAAAIHAGQTDLAVRVLEQAVVHNPGDPTLWYNLGTAYLLSTRPSRGRVAYEAAATLEPTYPTTTRLLRLAIEVENGSRDCPRTESEMKSAI